jgi:hypothetical protein
MCLGLLEYANILIYLLTCKNYAGTNLATARDASKNYADYLLT